MSSKYDSKQMNMLNQLKDDKPKSSLANDPCVKMETKLPGDKIQLILELTSKDKDKIFNALSIKGGSTPASAASGKRKSEDSSSATNYFLQAKEAKLKQNNADMEKRKAEMKAKSDLAMQENKKKQDRKKELDKIQGDDNFEHFKAHYEEDDAVFDTKKAVEDESYFTELKTCYDHWKENIEPELMQEAADEDENNLSTWSETKKMEFLQQMSDLNQDEQLEQLQENHAILNSELSIEHFAAWLANGSPDTTDSDREEKPFPGISELNGEEFDPDTFTMTIEFLPVSDGGASRFLSSLYCLAASFIWRS